MLSDCPALVDTRILPLLCARLQTGATLVGPGILPTQLFLLLGYAQRNTPIHCTAFFRGVIPNGVLVSVTL